MYIVILSFLGIAIFGLWIKVCADEKSDGYTAFGLMLLFILFVVFTISLMCHNASTPSAMDVYQGKTTLEITYKDGVAIDSVVVFKYKE